MDYFVLPYPYEKYSINELGEVINNKKQKKLAVWINKHGYKYFTLRNSKFNKKRNIAQHRL